MSLVNVLPSPTARRSLRLAALAALSLLATNAVAQPYPYGPGPYGPRGGGYGGSGGLTCFVAPGYRRQRASCPVGGYGKAPGDYCECRLWNYGPTVPGVIGGY